MPVVQYRSKDGSYKNLLQVYNGKDAYEIAVDKGFTGTRDEWLDSLKVKPHEIIEVGTAEIPTGESVQIYIREGEDEDAEINEKVDERIRTVLENAGIIESTVKQYDVSLLLPPIRESSTERSFKLATININSTDVIYANIEIYTIGNNSGVTSYGKFLAIASSTYQNITSITQHNGKSNMLGIRYADGRLIFLTHNSAWEARSSIFVKINFDFSSVNTDITIATNDECSVHNVNEVNTDELYAKYWISDTILDTDVTNPVVSGGTSITYEERTV